MIFSRSIYERKIKSTWCDIKLNTITKVPAMSKSRDKIIHTFNQVFYNEQNHITDLYLI